MIPFKANISQPFKPGTKSILHVHIRNSIDALFQEYQKSINGNTHDTIIRIDNELNVKTSKRSIPEILMEKPNPTPLRKCNDMNGILGKLIIYVINFLNFHFPKWIIWDSSEILYICLNRGIKCVQLYNFYSCHSNTSCEYQ